ncbi:MAG TPA: sulfite exporter TauE/SafE family protein [Pseudolabrys sp.]|nr:sulfite exporter TauE/SafE family protein [Pseudolabrys sp.]
MDHTYVLFAVAAIFLLAGFVKGVIGMGLPTVAIGLLSLTLTPAQAAAILVLPSLITNIWQFAAGGGLIALVTRLWPLLAGIGVGTFLGALLLPHSGSGQASMWLGIALAAYACLGLVKIEFTVPPRAETWLGLAVGIVNGAITAATGIFVLPGVPYVQALGLERDRLVQAFGLSFTVSTVTLALALQHAGEINTALLAPALLALAVSLVGMWLGQLVRDRIKPATFRLCFFIGLLALGLHLTLRGLL